MELLFLQNDISDIFCTHSASIFFGISAMFMIVRTINKNIFFY